MTDLVDGQCVLIERLRKSERYEEVYLKAYCSLTEARRELGICFDFHSRRRHHQGLDNRSPDEVYWTTLPPAKAAV